MTKTQFVGNLANQMIPQGWTMEMPMLGAVLNAADYRTNYGTEYEGRRGTYRLVAIAYAAFVAAGDQATADNIAEAFVTPRGEPAWK